MSDISQHLHLYDFKHLEVNCEPDKSPCLCPQDGETPLIKATKMRNIEVVELLLDKGAKVSAVDKVKRLCRGVLPREPLVD